MSERLSPKPFADRIADRLIAQLKEGTAPWQCPWEPGPSRLPMNPVTGKRYKGINAIALFMEGRSDGRWLTYRQAQSVDAQVKKGEQGTSVQYWKLDEQRKLLDEHGRPVLDAGGQPRTVTVLLERPRVFYATVFNAQQVEGLPALEHKPRAWDPVERADAILKGSAATIAHGGNTAFYSLARDAIGLPEQGQFPTAAAYYATALHELGHWTGHKSRLDRDLQHPYGSPEYAREELRAEIASLIVGDELGLGHDPTQHAAYVGHWIKSLEQDPLEVFRASAAAEKIRDYVLAFEQRQELGNAATHVASRISSHISSQAQEGKGLNMATDSSTAEDTSATADRRYLAVPYAQRRQASDAGARWDRQKKCWYVGPGASLDKLERWLPERTAPRQAPALDPRQEFGAALRELGLVLSEGDPRLDGQHHRVTVEGDDKGDKSGFYFGFLDGRPAGYAKNHKTGQEIRWKAKGYRLEPTEQAQLRAAAATKQHARAVELERLYAATAERLAAELARMQPATSPTPYMKLKSIAVHPGVYTNADGSTIVPATDVEGKVWTSQHIDAGGDKRFAKSARKHGCFHAVGGLERLASAEVLVIAEGYATAATVSELLGKPVVAAFDAGNLLPVAQALHAKHGKPVLIVADDDQAQQQKRGRNPGREKAEAAARAVQGSLVLPIFAPAEQRDNPKAFSDFNDLATRSVLGRDGAESQLKHAYGQTLARSREQEQQQGQQQEHRQARAPERRVRTI